MCVRLVAERKARQSETETVAMICRPAVDARERTKSETARSRASGGVKDSTPLRVRCQDRAKSDDVPSETRYRGITLLKGTNPPGN